MAKLSIIRMGHPTLREKARELSLEEINSAEIKTLIQDMRTAMHEANGVGLAAPQVNQSIQLALIEIDEDNPRYPDQPGVDIQVFINPKMTVLDAQNLAGCWEGCLSVPGLRGYVERPQKIQVDYQDETGQTQTMVAEGFTATVLQHELDHLDGVLYVDRLKSPEMLMFEEEFEQFHLEEDD